MPIDFTKLPKVEPEESTLKKGWKMLTQPIADSIPGGRAALEKFATPGLNTSPTMARLKGFASGALGAITPGHVAAALTLPEMAAGEGVSAGSGLLSRLTNSPIPGTGAIPFMSRAAAAAKSAPTAVKAASALGSGAMGLESGGKAVEDVNQGNYGKAALDAANSGLGVMGAVSGVRGLRTGGGGSASSGPNVEIQPTAQPGGRVLNPSKSGPDLVPAGTLRSQALNGPIPVATDTRTPAEIAADLARFHGKVQTAGGSPLDTVPSNPEKPAGLTAEAIAKQKRQDLLDEGTSMDNVLKYRAEQDAIKARKKLIDDAANKEGNVKTGGDTVTINTQDKTNIGQNRSIREKIGPPPPEKGEGGGPGEVNYTLPHDPKQLFPNRKSSIDEANRLNKLDDGSFYNATRDANGNFRVVKEADTTNTVPTSDSALDEAPGASPSQQDLLKAKNMNKADAQALAKHLKGEAVQVGPRVWRVKFPEEAAPTTEGIVPNDGVTPAPPVLDPEAQALRDQTAPFKPATPVVVGGDVNAAEDAAEAERVARNKANPSSMSNPGNLSPEEYSRWMDTRPLVNVQRTPAEQTEFEALSKKKVDPELWAKKQAGEATTQGDVPVGSEEPPIGEADEFDPAMLDVEGPPQGPDEEPPAPAPVVVPKTPKPKGPGPSKAAKFEAAAAKIANQVQPAPQVEAPPVVPGPAPAPSVPPQINPMGEAEPTLPGIEPTVNQAPPLAAPAMPSSPITGQSQLPVPESGNLFAGGPEPAPNNLFDQMGGPEPPPAPAPVAPTPPPTPLGPQGGAAPIMAQPAGRANPLAAKLADETLATKPPALANPDGDMNLADVPALGAKYNAAQAGQSSPAALRSSVAPSAPQLTAEEQADIEGAQHLIDDPNTKPLLKETAKRWLANFMSEKGLGGGQGGAATSQLLTRLGMGTVGGIAGDQTDPLGNHPLSAAAGAGLGFMAPEIAGSLSKAIPGVADLYAKGQPVAENALSTLNRFHNSGLLGPRSVAKKGAADVYGLLQASLEKPNVGSSIIKQLMSPEGRSLIGQNLKEGFNGTEADNAGQGLENFFQKGPLSYPGRAMGALTKGTKGIMNEAGLSPHDQDYYTMTSYPNTNIGKRAYQAIQGSKLLQHVEPFGRMGINRLEKAVDYSPLGLLSGKGKDAEQLQEMLKRAAYGSAATAATYNLTPKDFVKKHPFASGLVAAGPMGIPMLAAMAAKAASGEDGITNKAKAFTLAAKEVNRDVPGLQLLDQATTDPQGFARNYFAGYTNQGRDLATAINPEEVDTSSKALSGPQSLFNRALSNVPIVRGMLPRKGGEDIFKMGSGTQGKPLDLIDPAEFFKGK